MRSRKLFAPPTTATAAQKGQLLDLMEARPGENIEDALVKATTLKTLKSDLLPLRFNFAISRLFQIVGWNVKSDVLREFMEQQRLGRNTATFVAFNYDLILTAHRDSHVLKCGYQCER